LSGRKKFFSFQSGGKDVVVDVYNDCPVDSLSLELKRIGAKASTEQSRFLRQHRTSATIRITQQVPHKSCG
jgi:hypothetical protein